MAQSQVLPKVHIHGATAALMLHSTALATQDCDGLLFGEVRSKAITEFMDDDIAMSVREEQHVYITAFVRCPAQASFYDATGCLQADRLAALVPEGKGTLIGWLSIRSGVPQQPSMREAAVTAALASHIRGSATTAAARPCLLLLLGTRPENNGATLTFGYRAFSTPSASQTASGQASTASLQPVPLDVINLGRSLGHKEYEGFEPVMALHSSAGARPVSAGGAVAAAGAGGPGAAAQGSDPSAALAQTADAVVQQVSQLESYYQGLLSELQGLCRDVSLKAAGLGALQAEHQRLLAELGSLVEAGS